MTAEQFNQPLTDEHL